jgi:hypothetical protein
LNFDLGIANKKTFSKITYKTTSDMTQSKLKK